MANQICEYGTSIERLHTKISLTLSDSKVKQLDDDLVECQLDFAHLINGMVND